MIRAGTDYTANGERHWTIRETRRNVYEIVVNGVLQVIGGPGAVRRFLTNN